MIVSVGVGEALGGVVGSRCGCSGRGRCFVRTPMLRVVRRATVFWLTIMLSLGLFLWLRARIERGGEGSLRLLIACFVRVLSEAGT